MALSNRDRIGKMFEVMAPALDDFIATVIGAEDPALGAGWVKLVQAKDVKNGAPATKVYDPLDQHMQLRMLSENITGQYRQGWYPFNDVLSRTQQSYASELRDVRNSWAHNGSFTDDDAYRALDTAERLLVAVNAPEAAAAVKGIRLNLRRVTADRDDKRTLKAAAGVSPDSASGPSCTRSAPGPTAGSTHRRSSRRYRSRVRGRSVPAASRRYVRA